MERRINSEKQKCYNQIEKESNCNSNTTHPTTEQRRTEEGKLNVETIRRSMS